MYDYKAKEKNIKDLNNQMLNKTLSMFQWFDLPETIPALELEKLLQVNGSCFITEHKGDLYALKGALGGELDAYGRPTKYIVSNPWLNLNETYDVRKDGVLISNDSLKIGMMKLYGKANALLVENDINMLMWGVNSRTQNVISASDDKTMLSAQTYIKKVYEGELSVIGESALLDTVKIHNGGSSEGVGVKQLLEYHQYVKANLYNEIGLSSNFNMKKERLISSELDQAEDSLFPFVYNLLQCRYDAVELINEKYGLNIAVDFGSVWTFKNLKLIDGVQDNEQTDSEILSDDLGTIENDSTSVPKNEGQEEGQETEVEEPALEESALDEEPALEDEADLEDEVDLEDEAEQDQERDEGQDTSPELEPENDEEEKKD